MVLIVVVVIVVEIVVVVVVVEVVVVIVVEVVVVELIVAECKYFISASMKGYHNPSCDRGCGTSYSSPVDNIDRYVVLLSIPWYNYNNNDNTYI